MGALNSMQGPVPQERQSDEPGYSIALEWNFQAAPSPREGSRPPCQQLAESRSANPQGNEYRPKENRPTGWLIPASACAPPKDLPDLHGRAKLQPKVPHTEGTGFPTRERHVPDPSIPII